jgi:membrane dipeptidase
MTVLRFQSLHKEARNPYREEHACQGVRMHAPVPLRIIARRSAAFFLIALMSGISGAGPNAMAQSGGKGAEDFLEMHRLAVVVDGHNDVLGHVLSGERIDTRRSKGHSDLIRFAEGGVDVQLFSVWVPPKYVESKGEWSYALREIDSLDAIIRRNPSRIRKVTSAAELRAAVSAKVLAAVVALEGGHAVGDSRERIIELYRRGLRCFGLTWNNSTSWACSAADEQERRCLSGLSSRGKSYVKLLDSLGVLIDVSHLSKKGFYDVLATSRHPIIASHSCARALRDHYRNLDDEQLKAIAKRDGVVMVNFFPGFLRTTPGGKLDLLCGAYQKKLNAVTPAKDRFSPKTIGARRRVLLEARKRSVPTLLDVADHIDHIIAIAGVRHVGLGSDFDGIDFGPVGLSGVIDLPYLTQELLHRGHNREEVENILGGNFLRVFQAVCK